jgi:hypothetical protein
MTANQFRRLALTLSEVEERGHMDHPDFRVGAKIFATLGYPDKNWGMVKLTHALLGRPCRHLGFRCYIFFGILAHGMDGRNSK